MSFNEDIKKVKVIVSAIDGIITEGLTPYDELGNVPFKHYYIKDFEAINYLKRAFKFVFVASDNSISYHLCKRKNIPFYWDAKSQKESLVKVMAKYQVTPEEVLFIGSSYSDTDGFRLMPLSLCPDDAVWMVKDMATEIVPYVSGMGVLCGVHHMLSTEITRRKIES